ncbi:MAG: hypothetical protein ACLS20_14180 [Faecalimonas umbilicata]
MERLSHSVVVLNPFVCIWKGITTATGLQSSVVACLGMLLLGMLIIWRGKEKDILETDERNFDYSVKGTYGTAGYMKPEEQKEILNADQNLQNVMGIIFGKDLESGEYVSLPVDSRLNRNLARLRKPGKYEVKGICKKYGIAVCASWRVHVSYRSQIGVV